ncbi:hypothetical protein GSI_00063 [Ganoderma sinense ZZ0214-1]|uniref:Uncharacterized protein n=1 Tax=Ganoderma sinense ZZ0214-1 TaxID=1077348 RepID=A0A2G8SRH7_9APHY|nr:hypothetical protein GSI_00063 [Ganoderma sinense ZZ0214-1]
MERAHETEAVSKRDGFEHTVTTREKERAAPRSRRAPSTSQGSFQARQFGTCSNDEGDGMHGHPPLTVLCPAHGKP